MHVIVEPGNVNGSVTIPGSKSMMQRVCACALLHDGTTIIHNPGVSEDDKTAMEIVKQLRAVIEKGDNGSLIIKSGGILRPVTEIDCRESGLATRLFTPIVATLETPVRINGSGSLHGRSMHDFGTILPKLDVALTSFDGHVPFTVQGPLKPVAIKMDGSLSSQFLSGLLITLCFKATEPVTIEVNDLKSKKYIDLTIETLEHFGKVVEHEDYKLFRIIPSPFTKRREVDITIEGDWSSAAFVLTAGALKGAVTVKGLSLRSMQGDMAILDVLKDCGVMVKVSEDDEISLERPERLKAFAFDATHVPDLFPVLAILAARCQGTSRIRGLHRLKQKESDREKSIVEMLTLFGVVHHKEEDELVIWGGGALRSCTINGYNDHRIVMAAATGAIVADGQVSITDAEAVAKSYPSFFGDLATLGINCSINQ
jgi:3-phosphoshikimate 1-carboxyvinyltransferase